MFAARCGTVFKWEVLDCQSWFVEDVWVMGLIADLSLNGAKDLEKWRSSSCLCGLLDGFRHYFYLVIMAFRSRWYSSSLVAADSMGRKGAWTDLIG